MGITQTSAHRSPPATLTRGTYPYIMMMPLMKSFSCDNSQTAFKSYSSDPPPFAATMTPLDNLKDPRRRAKVRHFHIRYHLTRDLVDLEYDELKVLRVRSSDETTDVLTKSLSRSDFVRLWEYLGIHPPRVPWEGVSYILTAFYTSRCGSVYRFGRSRA